MKFSSLNLVKELTGHWWLVFVSGILFIGLGAWIILSPLKSYFSISLFLSGIVCAAGIMEVVFSLSNYKTLFGWGWYFAGGIIDMVVGGYLLAYPLVTMIMLPVLLGAWMLYRGIVTISHAFSIRPYRIKGWGWFLFAGMFIVLLSLFIIIDPALGALNFVVWTGIAFITSGLFRIALAVKLKIL